MFQLQANQFLMKKMLFSWEIPNQFCLLFETIFELFVFYFALFQVEFLIPFWKYVYVCYLNFFPFFFYFIFFFTFISLCKELKWPIWWFKDSEEFSSSDSISTFDFHFVGKSSNWLFFFFKENYVYVCVF